MRSSGTPSAVPSCADNSRFRPKTLPRARNGRPTAWPRDGFYLCPLRSRHPPFRRPAAVLTASIHAAGLGSIIADSHIDLRLGRSSVETLVAQGIDGLVVVGTTTRPRRFVPPRRQSRLSRPGPDRPTTIFAYNDITAIATLSAADDLNLGIPDDLSVVGYDNTYLSHSLPVADLG